MSLLCMSVILLPLLTTLVVSKKPNILILLADDLGIGDVGCYGNRTLKTPNIDSIAKEGIQLNHHLAAASLCTPSRAALLTGRYPVRSEWYLMFLSLLVNGPTPENLIPPHVTMNSACMWPFYMGFCQRMAPVGGLRVILWTASPHGLPASEISFANLAKQAGYKTGLIGKWHQGWNKDRLGDHDHHPRKFGFDYFYGVPLTNLKDFGDDGHKVIHHTFIKIYRNLIFSIIVVLMSAWFLYVKHYIRFWLACLMVLSVFFIAGYFVFSTYLKFLNSMIVRDFEIVEQPIDLRTQMLKEVAEGREFLEKRRADDQPFLLVMSWIHVHTALAVTKEFRGKTQHGTYGDAVEELDWAVGEMLTSLRELGLEDNTFVYFTSDHGGHLEEVNFQGEREGGHNGIFKGGKAHGAVDGGIRVPGIIRWPKHILAGIQSDRPTSLMDILPTLASIMDVPVPGDRQIDGRNLIPLLKGQSKGSPHEFLFHYCGQDVHAVRYMPEEGNKVWKLVFKEPDYIPGTQQCHFVCQCSNAITLDPPVLYEMTSDPGERRPISIQDHRDVYEKMSKALEEHLAGVIPVSSQMTMYMLLWRPWLQMCCNNNYPTCECRDKKFEGKF